MLSQFDQQWHTWEKRPKHCVAAGPLKVHGQPLKRAKTWLFVWHKWAAAWRTNKMTCVPSEDSDQSGHPPSLIKVFAVRMIKAWVLSYLLSALSSEDADQTGRMLRLIWVFTGCTDHFTGFVMRRLNYKHGNWKKTQTTWWLKPMFNGNDKPGQGINGPVALTWDPVSYKESKLTFVKVQLRVIIWINLVVRECHLQRAIQFGSRRFFKGFYHVWALGPPWSCDINCFNKFGSPCLKTVQTVIWATSWQNQQTDMCALRRLRSAWAPAQSDQSLHFMKKPWVLSYPFSAQRRLWSDWADAQAEHSEDSDQTWWMPRLIWVFAGCTVTLLGFVTRRLIWLQLSSSFRAKAVWNYWNLSVVLRFYGPVNS